MKVLFDNGTPRAIARDLTRHQVTLACQAGWHELANRALIQTAEGNGFDVLLTTDEKIRYQQNLSGRTIAIVVLTNGQWPAVKLQLGQITDAVDNCRPGDYAEVMIPLTRKQGQIS